MGLTDELQRLYFRLYDDQIVLDSDEEKEVKERIAEINGELEEARHDAKKYKEFYEIREKDFQRASEKLMDQENIR